MTDQNHTPETTSPIPVPELDDPLQAAIVEEANRQTDEIRNASDTKMDAIARKAGQQIRELRLARDHQIRLIKNHTQARLQALKAGMTDPGPFRAAAAPVVDVAAAFEASEAPGGDPPAVGSDPACPSPAQDEDIDPPSKPVDQLSSVHDDSGQGSEPQPRQRLIDAKSALQKNPDNPDLFCNLATIQIELGQKAQGMINYLRAAERYAQVGELAKAVQVYNMLIILQPNDVSLHEQMITIAIRLSDWETVLEQLKWLCNEYVENDELENALDVIGRVLNEAPNDLNVLNLKTDLLANCGMIEEACVHLAHSVGVFIQLNNWHAAHSMIERGIEIAPDRDMWSNLLADIEAFMKQSGIHPIAPEASGADDTDDADFKEWVSELNE